MVGNSPKTVDSDCRSASARCDRRDAFSPDLSISRLLMRLKLGHSSFVYIALTPGPRSSIVQFMLLIYDDESIYGPGKNGAAMQQIAAKHMAFNRELGGASR